MGRQAKQKRSTVRLPLKLIAAELRRSAMLAIGKIWLVPLGLAAVATMTIGPATYAQQITGTPCSPSATTTIDGSQLPAPPQKFDGTIEREATKSKPYWPARIVPPKGAPNVLLIITDDAG
jgi:hypothetical protein